MKDYFDSIFCINLKHHERRRQTVAMEFDSVGFDIANRLHIVNAIYGSDLPEMKDMIKSGIVANPFVDPGGNLTKNIIGCALSHKEAYKRML
jgi:GR25 family glycosyltransferase involved in LPS biosynthesis